MQFKGKGRWIQWNDAIKNVNLGDKNTKVQEIIVPTIDTVRYTYLLDLCISYGVLVFSHRGHTVEMINTDVKSASLEFFCASYTVIHMIHFSHCHSFNFNLNVSTSNLTKNIFFCLFNFSSQTSPVCWSYWHWEVCVCEGETDEQLGPRPLFTLLHQFFSPHKCEPNPGECFGTMDKRLFLKELFDY